MSSTADSTYVGTRPVSPQHAFDEGKLAAFIRDQVTKANTGAVTIAGGKEAAPVSTLHKCMACGTGLSRRPSKKKGHFWWGCSNYPGCKQTYPDLKGRPDYSKGRSGPADSTTDKE